MTKLAIRLATEYPCCHGRVVITATDYVPVEKYERTCPRCGTRWAVVRTTMKYGPDVRLDRLEWER